MAHIPDELFGQSVKDLARLCGVSERTARRWKDGTRCPSELVLMVLRADLGVFSSKWAGWTIRGEHLYSPEDWKIRMADVRAARLHEMQLNAYRSEIAKMKWQIEELERGGYSEDQPTPDAWDVQILTG